MSQPRYGSRSDSGRRDATIGLSGLAAGGSGAAVAGVAGRPLGREAFKYLGLRRELRQISRDGRRANEDARRAAGRLNEAAARFKRGGMSPDQMDANNKVAREAAELKARAQASGKRLMADRKFARDGLTSSASRLRSLARSPRAMAAAAGLGVALGGAGVGGYGLFRAERGRSVRTQERYGARQGLFADRLRPAVDSRSARALMPRGAPEGFRSFAEDQSSGKMVRQPSKRQAKFGSWVASGKSGEQWQREHDQEILRANPWMAEESGPAFRQVSR